MNAVIYLFSFLHKGTAFIVIVQFRCRLVRQYRVCVVDSVLCSMSSVITKSSKKRDKRQENETISNLERE